MIEIVKNFLQGLKAYSAPIFPNFRPVTSIVSASWYANCKPWAGIVIHHSATVDGANNDWGNIRHYHMSYRIDGEIVDETTFEQRQMLGHGTSFEKPWSDIGYHGGWEMVNGTYVFKVGRPWGVAGAHAGFKGNNTYNDSYLGLCAIGNFDKALPARELWELALSTVREIKQHFGFSNDKILGHREVYDQVGIPRLKTCPGTLWDMNKFRGEL